MRFLAPQPRLSSSELDYLTAVDHIRHEALIAVDPETGQSFGTARYIRDGDHPETAEFAVGVGDSWMRIGLGTALLEALVIRAREVGVIRFTGLIHTDNDAIRRLVKKVAGGLRGKVGGPGCGGGSVRSAHRGRPTAKCQPGGIARPEPLSLRGQAGVFVLTPQEPGSGEKRLRSDGVAGARRTQNQPASQPA